MSENLEHKCGLVAVIDRTGKTNVLQHTIQLAGHVQHRGELGAGITILDEDGKENRLKSHKGDGLVSEVLHPIRYDFAWKTYAAIAHVRYATCGTTDGDLIQPFTVETGDPETSFTLGFNGNIANYKAVKAFLADQGITLKRDVDTEAICELLRMQLNKGRSMQEAIAFLEEILDGCFNLTILTRAGELYAYRDRHGFRPLAYAEVDGVVAVASETSALNKVWGEITTKEVLPGQLLHFRRAMQKIGLPILHTPQESHCFFEWIYFANRLSIISGVPVNRVRYLLGEELANLDMTMSKDMIVVPVPDSAKIAAEGYRDRRGLRIVDVLLKNEGVGRTFTSAEGREEKAETKYNIDPDLMVRESEEEEDEDGEPLTVGRDIVLVDDSIVRGTTMRVLIKRMRHAAMQKIFAKKRKILQRDIVMEDLQPGEEKRLGKIHLRLACPPILHPCYYGIDMKSTSELIARKYSHGTFQKDGTLPQDVLDAIATDLGVDSIKFLPVPAVSRSLGIPQEKLCMACVTGAFPTPAGQAASDEEEQRNAVAA